jgi:hypothetical protein
MRIGRRLAILPLAAASLMAGPAQGEEPAAAWPDSMWSEPLWPAPAEEASVPDPVRFLPPITLDGAAPAAAAIAPAAGSRSGASGNTPYVAVGRPSEQRAPNVTFPEGVLGGPQMTLNPDGVARVTIIPELGTAPNFGTTVRGAGVSVQGGSSRVGVGVGVSRDETGRTSGGLGVTLTFP